MAQVLTNHGHHADGPPTHDSLPIRQCAGHCDPQDTLAEPSSQTVAFGVYLWDNFHQSAGGDLHECEQN